MKELLKRIRAARGHEPMELLSKNTNGTQWYSGQYCTFSGHVRVFQVLVRDEPPIPRYRTFNDLCDETDVLEVTANGTRVI